MEVKVEKPIKLEEPVVPEKDENNESRLTAPAFAAEPKNPSAVADVASIPKFEHFYSILLIKNMNIFL
jgi:hypothetical protein